MSKCSYCKSFVREHKSKHTDYTGRVHYEYYQYCAELKTRVMTNEYYLDILGYTQHPFKDFDTNSPHYRKRECGQKPDLMPADCPPE